MGSTSNIFLGPSCPAPCLPCLAYLDLNQGLKYHQLRNYEINFHQTHHKNSHA